LCQNIDCDACAASNECRTPNPVLSKDGTTTKLSCVCINTSIKGDACNIVVSGKDGTPSPDIRVPTANVDGKASITGAGGDAFQLRGGRIDPDKTSQFTDKPIVVDIDRLDANGAPKPGPLATGVYARIKLCSSLFVDTKEPELYLVEAALKASKAVCEEINGGTAPPKPTFADGCWTFYVCHASTYAGGTLGFANDAVVAGVSIVSVGLGLFVL
jgi:hypothetical protein